MGSKNAVLILAAAVACLLLCGGQVEAKRNNGKERKGTCEAAWCAGLEQGKHYYKRKNYSYAITALEQAAAGGGSRSYDVLYFLAKAHYDRMGGDGSSMNDDIAAALRYAEQAAAAPCTPEEQEAAESLLSDLQDQFVPVTVVPVPESESKLECFIVNPKKLRVYNEILRMVERREIIRRTVLYFPTGADCKVGRYQFKTERGADIAEVFVPSGRPSSESSNFNSVAVTGLMAYLTDDQDGLVYTYGGKVRARGMLGWQPLQLELQGYYSEKNPKPQLGKVDGGLALTAGLSGRIHLFWRISLVGGLNVGLTWLFGPDEWGGVLEAEIAIGVTDYLALGVSPRMEYSFGDTEPFWWYPITLQYTPFAWR
jgi:hypothetical protein